MNKFNDNTNKKNLNSESISFTTYRTNYPNDEMMKTNHGIPSYDGSGADLEDNHQTTINVSNYSEPVEITPTEGKDGMKKATVTLTNIPSGGGTMSTNMPSWTYNEGDIDDGSNRIDVSRVIPDGVKVYYYDYDRGAGVLTGDGVKAIEAYYIGTSYFIEDCYFIASCGDDMAVYMLSGQRESEEP